MLEVASAQGAIELGPDQVLQHRAGILHPRRVALPFFGLGDHIAHQRSQAARGIQANLERLGRKELMHALNPERFHGIEIDRAAGGLAVEESHILAHVADAAATGAPAFSG